MKILIFLLMISVSYAQHNEAMWSKEEAKEALKTSKPKPAANKIKVEKKKPVDMDDFASIVKKINESSLDSQGKKEAIDLWIRMRGQDNSLSRRNPKADLKEKNVVEKEVPKAKGH